MTVRDEPIAVLLFHDARGRFLKAWAEFIADKSVSDAEKRDELAATVSAMASVEQAS